VSSAFHSLFCVSLQLHSPAGEDRLQVVILTATTAANDPQLFPYPLKEGWWVVWMAKS